MCDSRAAVAWAHYISILRVHLVAYKLFRATPRSYINSNDINVPLYKREGVCVMSRAYRIAFPVVIKFPLEIYYLRETSCIVRIYLFYNIMSFSIYSDTLDIIYLIYNKYNGCIFDYIANRGQKISLRSIIINIIHNLSTSASNLDSFCVYVINVASLSHKIVDG